MKALVHIGTEKTGTTTIQHFLHQNRDKLREQGIAYLRSPGPVKNRDLATYCMSNNNVDEHVITLGIVSDRKRARWKANFKKRFDRELRKLDRRIHLVIFSAEFFQSRLRTEDEVRNLQTLLSRYFDQIEILVYLRRQDQFAVSFYSTLCRTGSTQEEVLKPIYSANDSYSQHFNWEYFNLNYYELVTKWANVFGRENIIIRVFDIDRFCNGDLLDDFRYAAGIADCDQFLIPEWANENLSSQLQRLLVLFNRCFPTYTDETTLSPFNVALREHLIAALEKKYTGNGRLPAKAEAKEFYDLFSVSNRRLANEFLNSESLFSDDFSSYQDGATEENILTVEAITDMLCAMSDFFERRAARLQVGRYMREKIAALESRSESAPTGTERSGYSSIVWLLSLLFGRNAQGD